MDILVRFCVSKPNLLRKVQRTNQTNKELLKRAVFAHVTFGEVLLFLGFLFYNQTPNPRTGNLNLLVRTLRISSRKMSFLLLRMASYVHTSL